ncbi:hypothetical protein ABT263_02355 [Kitasatospora sp. NPDC001603]|uniref:hypothetical protein n=1 Tax=Kitasatospora sp. NPDC001603 TaxID=3154388 RepID=UPI00331693C3
MTRYSVDPARHELIAAWGTGGGDLSARVAVLPAEADTAVLLRLAGTLTQLSEAAWRTYTHPASAADSLESGSEGWRREREREAFGEVAAAVARPNLPQGGMLTVSYSPLVESANRIGRALVGLGDPELSATVLAEAAQELAAVESAELGDLSGRAQQAVLLSREDASPAQVAAADHLFRQDPFGPAELFSGIDPTAAAVAAAHWLTAAAEIAAEASGHDRATVVLEADAIEALAHETPTLVLELIDAGASPHDAVAGLVRHALQVADGLLPDPTALRDQLNDFEEALAEYSEGDGDGGLDPEDTGLRLTPLDPRRPARDLLEDLLAGIHGCWLLHDQYTDSDHDEDATPETPAHEDDEEAAEELHQQRSRGQFAARVRAVAARDRDRLV